LDFARLHALHEAGSFFLIRAKRGMRFKRRYSRPVDRINTKVLCDQTGTLEVYYSKQGYPTPLRRVVVKNEDGKRITFLTNNTQLAPDVVGELYRLRWQVELFFKWIKQHLRIKAFFGTSENAVKTQIWIAVATYVLIAIVKKRAMLPHSLYELLQILSLTMFETTPINQLLTTPGPPPDDDFDPEQLALL
jgi:IS4 transposase